MAFDKERWEGRDAELPIADLPVYLSNFRTHLPERAKLTSAFFS